MSEIERDYADDSKRAGNKPDPEFGPAFDVTFGPCDPLNPGFGYWIEVLRNGVQLLKTSRDPATGEDLD